jgi:hypothetical protein
VWGLCDTVRLQTYQNNAKPEIIGIIGSHPLRTPEVGICAV